MCRIAGIWQGPAATNDSQSRVARMCQVLQHGGPDDEGIYTSEATGLVLGNRRLALIDLSREGHMPMHYLDRYVITYNGELYNHHTLRDELRLLGHHFRGHSDTEVILAAFAQWGTLSFARLHGMYAFALLDTHEQRLLLVRDPAGIKPLYFTSGKAILAFASEVRALQDVPNCTESHPNWPVYMMAYGHLPEPVTTRQSVKSLRKGCYLDINLQNGCIRLHSFSHYSYSDSGQNPQQLKTLLNDAVQRHLVADAPLGVFLSGGVDSSILALLAARHKPGETLNTLSLYFEENAYSEKKYQDLIIEQLHCKNTQYLLTEPEFHQSFQSILDAMDMPSSDGINTWFISQIARKEGLKAVLSGLGGDELFGGYPSFSRIHPARLLQQLPAPLIRSGRRSRFKRLNRMAYLNLEGALGIYLFLRGHFSPYEIARQLDMSEKEVWNILQEKPALPDLSGIDEKNQASWVEFNLYMQNQLLRDADVMSMIHGVEIRVPFLDDTLIRYALSLHPEMKYTGSRPKQILIDQFSSELPEPIWNRPKMGFSFPFAKWLGNNPYVKEIMLNGNKNTRKNYQRFLDGKLHWSHLMTMVILKHRHAPGYA